MVNDRYIIWIRNGKVGSTSLNKAFSGVFAPNDFKGSGNITLTPEKGKIIELHTMTGAYSGAGISVNDFKEKYPSIWKESFKFIVVRNPYDKWVSAWASMKELNDRFSFKEVVDINVEEFCKGFSEYDNWVRHIEYHLTAPQSWCTITEDGQLDVDLIVRFENLEEEYNKLCEITGIEGGKLEKMRVSKHKNYKEYYTQEIADKVYNKVESDFKLFGYDKDSWK